MASETLRTPCGAWFSLDSGWTSYGCDTRGVGLVASVGEVKEKRQGIKEKRTIKDERS